MVLLAFLFVSRYLEPFPPDSLRLAVGPPEGSYSWLGERYAQALESEGLRLELVESEGSFQSLELVKSGQVDAAFVQSGVTLADNEEEEIFFLGSLYFEPVWVFTRGEEPLDDLMALEGKRLGIGAPNSGSHSIAASLLRQIGLADRCELVEAHQSSLLLEGEVDAIFLVASSNAPQVRELLENPLAQLATFRRAHGYTRHLGFLSELELHEGAVDLAKNLPGRDVKLLAATATLVVGKDFHPALTGVVLGAAQRIHDQPGPLHDRGDFPSPEYGSFPTTREAEFFHRNGPSFLQGRLPYKAAATLERVLILLLPLLTVVLPLAKILPAIYGWRMKSKIYKPYKELLELEGQLDRDDFQERLAALESEARELLKMPPAYGSEVQNLLLHIERLKNRCSSPKVRP